MDESWRMRMGMAAGKPAVPRRRSTEDHSRRSVLGESDSTLDPDDFNDVFGGPPRSVLHRQFSGGFGISGPDFFYQEVFKVPEDGGPLRSGRNLPEFRIPVSRDGRRSEEFYSDIFGKDVEDLRRSRSRSKNSKSKSKSNSSSVLSSEDLSPFRPAVTEDDISFASFASKLRPINVPPKWNSDSVKHEVQAQQKEIQHSPYRNYVENEYLNNLRSSQFGLSQRPSSPETNNVEQHSYKLSAADNLELNSPSSMISSLCHENQENKAAGKMDGQDALDDDDDDDEIMSSYVIEINADRRGEALNVDDAIAWAKEKFQTKSAKDYSAISKERDEGKIVGCGSMQSPGDTEKWNTEGEKQQLEKETEMELLSEDIKMWSYGKEANIQLLLSSLHHIMWSSSGWNQISIVNLQESSNLKKAYQKARLCLHPDKLQQRGATMQQKYIAEKAFPILQDAWAAFISQEASL